MLVLTYLAAGAGLAAIIGAFIGFAQFLASRKDRSDARRRSEYDAGREATTAAFRIQLELNEQLRGENSRLARRLGDLEHDFEEARELYADEMARMREQIRQLLAREA